MSTETLEEFLAKAIEYHELNKLLQPIYEKAKENQISFIIPIIENYVGIKEEMELINSRKTAKR